MKTVKYPEHTKLHILTESRRLALEEFIEYVDKKSDFVVSKLLNDGGIECVTLQDAFYSMLGIDKNAFEEEKVQMIEEKKDGKK